VTIPALLKNRLLVESVGADTVRLLTVIVPGKLPDVVASIVTVLDVSLVMRTADCVFVGATPSDHLPKSSQYPRVGLIQLLSAPWAENTARVN
jgi:hypothetical protein